MSTEIGSGQAGQRHLNSESLCGSDPARAHRRQPKEIKKYNDLLGMPENRKKTSEFFVLNS